jgi:Fe-S-cluster containining protein
MPETASGATMTGTDRNPIRCRRCGTCCRKGGPALHLEDRHLVERGLIPLKDLMTLRKGEKVRDDVKGELIELAGEIIKVKGRDNAWTCIYFDAEDHRCRIYANRPIECRTLDCRDTAPLEAMYARGRLSRRDLLSDIEGWWDLIVDHESRCAYDKVSLWVRRARSGQWATVKTQFVRLVAYDAQIRRLLAERGMAAAVDKLDFLLGRPLTETLPAFGFHIRQQADGFVIVPLA